MAEHRETNYNRPAVDPYGFAMRKVMYGLTKGLMYQGQMSEEELSILQELKEVIRRRDPASLDILIDKR